ncbi:MAG: T9SS type A sorting domain-containing protein [Candidatus Kryptonium sp.]|nr:T9SS type A sorting domain-containing protein [Candidatus Kryptonium sp.]
MIKRMLTYSFFFLIPVILYSQIIQYHSVPESYTQTRNLLEYRSRVKYDPSGNIRILTCDGQRFYEINDKNGYFGSLKPIARADIRFALFASTEPSQYDFEIDQSGVIHIGFAYTETHVVHLFYTNSQIDTVYYIRRDTLFYQHFKINALRTDDNQIVINYIQYLPNRINWTQIVNPQAGLSPKFRSIPLPNYTRVYPFANKNLFVNALSIQLTQDTLKYTYVFHKFDINAQGDEIISSTTSSIRTPLSDPPAVVELPFYYIANNNDGYVLASKIFIETTISYFRIRTSLDSSIFALDRQNNLHVLKINSQVSSDYYLFSPSQLPISSFSNNTLYHSINYSMFIPNLNTSIWGIYPNEVASISALNANDATILFNFPEYLIRQKQRSFTYRYILSYRFYIGSRSIFDIVKLGSKFFMLHPSSNAGYVEVNDTTGAIYLYELVQRGNEFVTAIDTSNIRRVLVPARIGLRPRYTRPIPIVKVDRNQNIHTLIFKVLDYNTRVGIDLGQWYYYKITPDLRVEGGYRVTAESDTVTPLGTFDFDIDDNGIVHFAYFKSVDLSRAVIRYTNNSSGSFANPINVGDTISIISSPYWLRVKATPNGNAYVVYLPYSPPRVYLTYGNLNGFTRPKEWFVAQGLDRFGGRNVLDFAVDGSGVMHVFHIPYWYSSGSATYNNVLVYAYRVMRDSIIFISGVYTNLQETQCVLMERDKNGNIHILGYNKGRVYYLNSLDNFRNVRFYNLSDYNLFRLLRSTEAPPFMDIFKILYPDESQNRVYFALGRALQDVIIGWIPYTITGIERDNEIIPSKFALHQNYPNPFNPVTKIEFEIPQRENVKLVIYDVLGREVKRVIDGELDAGRYKVDVDMSDYSSGVYFYRLEAGKFSSIKKMMLLK